MMNGYGEWVVTIPGDEYERLKETAAEIEKWTETARASEKRVAAAQAEIERLRAALREIKETLFTQSCTCSFAVDKIIARAALEEKP